jgi:hypothetical protein
MKINPVAVGAYQRVVGKDVSAPAVGDNSRAQAVESTVTIQPQNRTAPAALAVKAPAGDYAEYLTSEERAALEKLFTHLRDTSRFGSGYRTVGKSAAGSGHLGNLVDVEV